MRNFHSSVDKSDLIDGLDLRRESSMDAEDLAFDDGAEPEVELHVDGVFGVCD